MNFNPTNTASRFTTKLSEMIELDGNWEVGLVEISMPRSIVNVRTDDHYYYAFLTQDCNNEHADRIVLSPGSYANVKDALRALLKAHSEKYEFWRSDKDALVIFRYVSTNKRVSVRIRHREDNNIFGIQFSPALAEMLGFNQHVVYEGLQEYRAFNPPDMHVNNNLLYVYCDLLEQIIVGDTKAALLRIVDRVPDDHQFDGINHAVFHPITYVPLQKKFFDMIEMLLMTDQGEPMPFIDGKSIVVLEFRRAAHPYLLL